jgi:hypothetical protein
MDIGQATPPSHGLWRGLVRWWFALTRRKIRLLYAGGITVDGPVVIAVGHPAGFLPALALSTAIKHPAHCLLPKSLVRGPLARFLARHMGIILCEDEKPASEESLQEAVDVLARRETLVAFADQNSARQGGHGTLASTTALVVGRAEAQSVGRRIAVHPAHLFLSEASGQEREILIYVDSVLVRPVRRPEARPQEGEVAAFIAALESRFQENAFQLRPADLEYFLGDLEEVLRTSLQEDWASRPDWKQDTGDFVLSRLVKEWVNQTNYSHPSRLVALRKSLDEYRHLQKECALRELEVEGADSPLGSGWRQTSLWFETLLGLPIALYGLLNHLVIGLVLYLAGSFKRNSSRARTTEWILRGAVTLGFYALQIFLMGRFRGRAAAGYYAPSLPVSGAYLWRYVGLVRPQARLLFISLTIPALKRKIQRLRHTLLEELDQELTSCEEKTSVPR